jgi:glycosyltransferase involved in cell wall biosynthesis
MQRGESSRANAGKSTRLRPLDKACLGVVVPAFNEARTIDELLRRVLVQPSVCEIVVVDDASSDGTGDLLRSWPQRDPRVRVLEHPVNRGKGAAIRTALAASKAPVVIVQDADLEYSPEDYVPMLELILTHQADVVYGSRFSMKDKLSRSSWHTFGNRCLTWCSNLASGLKLTDEATCYKMFRREVLEQIKVEENGFGFCPEVTAKISKLGVRIREVPVSYHPRTVAEGKKIRIKDGWNALKCVIKYNFFFH